MLVLKLLVRLHLNARSPNLFGDLDSAVVINEAVEITKAFGTEQSPKFINGVLDAVSKNKTE